MKSLILLIGLLTFVPFLIATSTEADEMENDMQLSREKRQRRCPTVTFPCSRMPSVCRNMRNAIRRGKPTRLNRIISPSLIASNRRLSGCRQLPSRPGFNCDEYPFASSRQGGRGAVIANVPVRENSRQGGVLSAFYRRNRIGNGDCYTVSLGP